MKVYDNAPNEKLQKFAKELTAAVEEEGRMLNFGAGAIVYSAIAFAVVMVLAAIFDHTMFRIILPASILACIVAVNTTISAVKWNCWRKRYEAEKKYFDQSQIVSEYNSNSVLQLMAMHEFVDMSKLSDADRQRTIN